MLGYIGIMEEKMAATIVYWDYMIVSGYDFGLTTQGYHSGAAIILRPHY